MNCADTNSDEEFECLSCEQGFFQPNYTLCTTHCHQCTVCSPGQVVLDACTDESDTVCGAPVPHPTPGLTGTSTPGSTEISKPSSDSPSSRALESTTPHPPVTAPASTFHATQADKSINAPETVLPDVQMVTKPESSFHQTSTTDRIVIGIISALLIIVSCILVLKCLENHKLKEKLKNRLERGDGDENQNLPINNDREERYVDADHVCRVANEEQGAGPGHRENELYDAINPGRDIPGDPGQAGPSQWERRGSDPGAHLPLGEPLYASVDKSKKKGVRSARGRDESTHHTRGEGPCKDQNKHSSDNESNFLTRKLQKIKDCRSQLNRKRKKEAGEVATIDEQIPLMPLKTDGPSVDRRKEDGAESNHSPPNTLTKTAGASTTDVANGEEAIQGGNPADIDQGMLPPSPMTHQAAGQLNNTHSSTTFTNASTDAALEGTPDLDPATGTSHPGTTENNFPSSQDAVSKGTTTITTGGTDVSMQGAGSRETGDGAINGAASNIGATDSAAAENNYPSTQEVSPTDEAIHSDVDSGTEIASRQHTSSVNTFPTRTRESTHPTTQLTSTITEEPSVKSNEAVSIKFLQRMADKISIMCAKKVCREFDFGEHYIDDILDRVRNEEITIELLKKLKNKKGATLTYAVLMECLNKVGNKDAADCLIKEFKIQFQTKL